MIRSRSELTFCRSRLVEAAKENLQIASTGNYVNKNGDEVDVSQVTKNAVKNSIHYDISHKFIVPEILTKTETSITVLFASPIEAAIALRKDGADHVGVLNSASSQNAGGGCLHGTLNLESCLCRGSLLLPCLSKFESESDHFYKINAKYATKLGCCTIFSPNVPIIREDSMEAVLLDDYEICSIVSIPPPNAFLFGHGEDAVKAVRNATYDRIFRALCIFSQQGCRDLVLCAIGCVSHGNNPNIVAEVFDHLLSNLFKNHFDRVIFAMNPKKPAVYNAFLSVLQK